MKIEIDTDWARPMLDLHPKIKASIRLYDPLSDWQAFILGSNPDDNDQVVAIISGWSLEIVITRISTLGSLYNGLGDNPIYDVHFRPTNAATLYRRIENEQR